MAFHLVQWQLVGKVYIVKITKKISIIILAQMVI